MPILQGHIFVLMTLASNVMSTSNTDFGGVIAGAMQQAEQELMFQKMQDEMLYRAGIDGDENKRESSKRMLANFNNLQRADNQEAERGSILTRASQILSKVYSTSVKELRNNPIFLSHWTRLSSNFCKPMVYHCDPNAYRSIDGSCNNLVYPAWGKTDRGQQRFIPSVYADGVDVPRSYSVTGKSLPSPRTVSNALHRAPMINVFEHQQSMLVMQWGQLIDHDLINTPMLKGFRGSDITCCNLPKNVKNTRTACFPINIAPGDPFFKQACMNFVRSAPSCRDDCGPSQREQLNQASSYIDVGFLYGTDTDSMDTLRARSHGMLKMTDCGFFVPDKDQTTCMRGNNYCMKSGDHRIHIFPGLSSTQILMLREHNRIAVQLSKINPHWDDERLFQETRTIMIALTQKITYDEFLQKVIGPDMMWRLGLNIKPKGYNTVYDPTVDATITNAFGVAAFRFGHTLIPGNVNMYYKNTTQEAFRTENQFNRPNIMFADGCRGGDHVSRWMIHAPAARGDRFIEPAVRDKLFLDKDGNSFDLVSLNIQRGRDHGVPGYNAFRRMCNLPVAKTFYNMPDVDVYAAKAFASVYKHPDDIDLFSGGLSETRLPGALVGPTFACIIGQQFKNLKYGDRFYFENNFNIGFTLAQLDSIKTQSFANLMCLNNGERQVSLDSFAVPSAKNPYVSCSSLPQLQLWYWREIPLGTADVTAVRPPFTYISKFPMKMLKG